MSERSITQTVNEMKKLAYVAEHSINCEDWERSLKRYKFASMIATMQLRSLFESFYQLDPEIDSSNTPEDMLIDGSNTMPLVYRGSPIRIMMPYMVAIVDGAEMMPLFLEGQRDVLYTDIKLRTPLEAKESHYGHPGPHFHGTISLGGIEKHTYHFMTPFSQLEVSDDFRPYLHN